jgi:hypothetical protein
VCDSFCIQEKLQHDKDLRGEMQKNARLLLTKRIDKGSSSTMGSTDRTPGPAPQPEPNRKVNLAGGSPTSDRVPDQPTQGGDIGGDYLAGVAERSTAEG